MRPLRNPDELHALVVANAPGRMVISLSETRTWVSDPRNIALRIGDDLGMFEHFGDGIYQGHISFASRGRTALDRARAMLAEMLDNHGARTIYGETPTERRDVLFFVRKLGFRPVRETERPQGRVVFSVLDKRELTAARECGMREADTLAPA